MNSHLIAVEGFEYPFDPGCCVVVAKKLLVGSPKAMWSQVDKTRFSAIDSDDNAGELFLEEGDWGTLLEPSLG